MNKWYKLLIASVMALSLMNGCAEPKTPAQLVAQSSDKEMMKAFSKLEVLEDSEFLSEYSPADIIRIRMPSVGNVHPSMATALSRYSSKYNSSTDKKARAYVKVAKARGNTVKLYKNFINNKIASKIVHPFMERGSKHKTPIYNLDPALIEFDKNGRIISILVRRHYITPFTHGVVSQDRDTIVILGNTASKMEMSIDNNTLNNGYITTL
jgi:hypothetical protein